MGGYGGVGAVLGEREKKMLWKVLVLARKFLVKKNLKTKDYEQFSFFFVSLASRPLGIRITCLLRSPSQAFRGQKLW